MSNSAVACVARHSRLLVIARRFLDAEPIPYRATLFDKSPQNNWLVVWHQDTALPLRGRCHTAGWGPWSIKGGITYAHAPAAALARVIALRLHIDDSDADNGPLGDSRNAHARRSVGFRRAASGCSEPTGRLHRAGRRRLGHAPAAPARLVQGGVRSSASSAAH